MIRYKITYTIGLRMDMQPNYDFGSSREFLLTEGISEEDAKSQARDLRKDHSSIILVAVEERPVSLD